MVVAGRDQALGRTFDQHMPELDGLARPAGCRSAADDLVKRKPETIRHRQAAQKLLGLKCH